MRSAFPELNTIVDQESKHCHDSSNWELCLSVLKVPNHLLGPFSIDLFASRIMQSSIASLLQLESRSRSLGPNCRCISILWPREIPYLFPPLPDGQSLVEDPQRSSQSCMLGSASMAISDLVFTIARHVSRLILMLLPVEDDLLLSPDQRSHPLQLEKKAYA